MNRAYALLGLVIALLLIAPLLPRYPVRINTTTAGCVR